MVITPVGDEICDLARARSASLGAAAASAVDRAFVCTRLASLPAPSSTELGHVGPLSEPLVAPLLLAKRLVRAGHVEDVVDDLEQHAQLAGELVEVRDCGRLRRFRRASSTQSMLAPISLPVLSSCSLRRPAAPAAARSRHVEVLTADHSLHPGRRGQLAGRGRRTLRRLAPLLGQQEPERLGVESRRRPGSRRPRRTPRGRSAARGADRRRPSPAGRRGSASRCGSARARPPAAARDTGSRPIAAAVASASTGRIRLPPASSE